MTLNAACDWYWKVAGSLRKNAENDLLVVKRIKESMGDKTLATVSGEDIVNFRNSLYRKNLCHRVVKHHHSFLGTIFNALTKHDLYKGRNPSKLIAFEKVPDAAPKFISDEDLRKINAEALKNPAFYPYFHVALNTGLRIGEITSINVSDYDYEKKLIFLRNTKNGKSRHVHLSNAVNGFIQEIVKTRVNNGLLLGNYTRFTVSDCFREIVRKLGLRDITFHCLRHAFVNRLLSNGVSIYKASKMVGHSSVSVTEQIYGHLSKNDLESAFDVINKAFNYEGSTEVAYGAISSR
ncbi:MAG: site-specific integrase [Elusimicrobia bacterium]|nr:site-specific integrase [Elusimicrobiota bacterium]